MRFYVRKRRQPPAVIIVALIDILIVLLIFLMVTTTFKQQPALKLTLPESSQAKKAGANEEAPLVISIDEKGQFRFGADAKAVSTEGLRSELMAAVSKKPDLRVALNADQLAPFGKIVKVMDAAKEAGITNVSAHTKETSPP